MPAAQPDSARPAEPGWWPHTHDPAETNMVWGGGTCSEVGPNVRELCLISLSCPSKTLGDLQELGEEFSPLLVPGRPREMSTHPHSCPLAKLPVVSQYTDQRQQDPLKTCQKCKFLSPISNPLNRNSGGSVQQSGLTSPPSDYDACSSLRTTAVICNFPDSSLKHNCHLSCVQNIIHGSVLPQNQALALLLSSKATYFTEEERWREK